MKANRILMNQDTRVLISDGRFLGLFNQTLSRIPSRVQPLRTLKTVRLRQRSRKRGLVGITKYCCIEYESAGVNGRDSSSTTPPRQSIIFYKDLIDRLSDNAAIAVIVHELAHAWLNEHTTPEESKRREIEADEVARKWGFGRELEVLAGETEPLES